MGHFERLGQQKPLLLLLLLLDNRSINESPSYRPAALLNDSN